MSTRVYTHITRRQCFVQLSSVFRTPGTWVSGFSCSAELDVHIIVNIRLFCSFRNGMLLFQRYSSLAVQWWHEVVARKQFIDKRIISIHVHDRVAENKRNRLLFILWTLWRTTVIIPARNAYIRINRIILIWNAIKCYREGKKITSTGGKRIGIKYYVI